ncbi:MAG TPA: MFS transporter [Candidatus Korarchaeota archaeon]|nr:MFS transporter [Candidatus Korarchaeota archaeon]
MSINAYENSYSFARLLVARVIASVALLYQPALWALMADSLPEQERGRYMALSNTISGVFGMLGPAVAAWIVKVRGIESGVRFLYFLSAVGLMLGSLVRMFLMETIPMKTKPSLKGMLRDYIKVLPLFRKEIGRVAIISGLGMAFMGLIDPFIQIYAVESLEIDPAYWGFANLVASIAGLLSQPLSGYLTDKVGRREVVSLSFLTTSIGYLILFLSPKGSKNFILASLLAASIMPRFPALFALRADVTVPEIRGRVDAISRLISNLMLSASNVAGGHLYDLSPSATILTSVLLMGFMAVASFVLLPSKPDFMEIRGEHPESED